jgi:hypothetical protein
MTWPHGREKPAEPPAHYELRVKGVLDSGWSAWFGGLRVTSDQAGQTTIAGPVTDQAALHGLLAKSAISACRCSRYAASTQTYLPADASQQPGFAAPL